MKQLIKSPFIAHSAEAEMRDVFLMKYRNVSVTHRTGIYAEVVTIKLVHEKAWKTFTARLYAWRGWTIVTQPSA